MKRACVGMLVLAGIVLYGCAHCSPSVAVANGAVGAGANQSGYRSVNAAEATGRATAKVDVEVHGVLVIGASAMWTKQLRFAVKRGLVVVSYREDGLRLMPNCYGLGGYGFAKVREKSRKVSVSDAERSVFPPLVDVNAQGLCSGFQSLVDSESVARPAGQVSGQGPFEIVQRGLISSALQRVFADQLQGDCDGATHFVRRMHVGAFVSPRMAGGLRHAVTCETTTDVFQSEGCQVVSWELGALGKNREPREWASTEFSAVAPVSLCPKGMWYDGMICRAGSGTCEDGDGVACFDQARAEQRKGGDGALHFSKGCQALHDDSCAALGAVEFDENAHEQQAESRRKTLEIACESGSGAACVSLSQKLLHGVGDVQQRQQPQRRSLLLRGCLLGDVHGCVALAQLGATEASDAGQIGNARQDSACAWRMACDGGNGQLCWSLGRALRTAPHMLQSCGSLAGGAGGVFGEMDELGAMMGGCHRGCARSCGVAGRLLVQSTHNKGMLEGKDYLIAGCDGDNADWEACLQLGALLVQQKAEIQAQNTYKKLCDMREIVGCERGEQVALSRGDEAAAMAFASSKCVAGVVESCTKLAQAYEAKGQHAQAKRWLTEACDRFGDRSACAEARRVNLNQSN